MVEINTDLCIGCGACVKDCAGNVLFLKDGKAQVERNCMQCGHCVAICPKNAVAIPGYDMLDVTEYDKACFTLNPDHYLNAVKFRRSIRRFQNRPVNQEILLSLAEVGRYTPTAVNLQGTAFVFVQDHLEEFKPLAWQGWLAFAEALSKEQAMMAELIRSYCRLYKENSQNDRLFLHAPAMLLVVTDNPWDGGLAAQNIEMMAVAQGLGVLHNGFLLRAIKHNSQAINWLGIDGKTISCCMLLGYPDITYKRTAPRKKANVIWK